jgi:pimeloyl-ACP methyl ester carboxylesterase
MSPVLFIPGLLCSAEVFGPQVNALWRFGPVMVASTLEASTIGDAAAKILERAPPRFALAGLSMGGYICFEIIRQAPRRVLRLALLDTSARPDTPEQSAIRRESLEEARSNGFLGVALQNLNGLLHPSRRNERSLLDINRRMALSVGLEGFARQLEIAISRPDSRPDLKAIRVPTLAIVGDSDPLTPVERSEEIVSLVPDSRLVVLPACGHLSPIERPDLVSRALQEWLGWPGAADVR